MPRPDQGRAGTLVLTGANTYTGPTIVGGGSLARQHGEHPYRGHIAERRQRDLQQDADATLTTVVSGNGSFTKNGAGMLTLTVARATAGATTIGGGTLQLGRRGFAATGLTAARQPHRAAWTLTNAASLGSPTNGGNVTTWTNLATVGNVGNFTGTADL